MSYIFTSQLDSDPALHTHGYACGVMGSSAKWQIRMLSSISSQVCCIHLCKNIIGKGMNPSSPPVMG